MRSAVIRFTAVALLAVTPLACGGGEPRAGGATADADTARVISLDERVDDSQSLTAGADSAPEAGASTRLTGLEARMWDARTGTFTSVGDSVHLSPDSPSGALLVVVAGQAPPGSVPATIQLLATEAERVVFSTGFAPAFQVGEDGSFRAPFLISGSRCLPLRLVARSEGGREVERRVVFTCGP